MVARHAIFVDAGYFFAQGSFALTGQKQSRHQLRIQIPEAIERLKEFARNKAPETQLLRIYWYDAAPGSPSREQQELSYLDDVKLRLGFLNTQGQQKGVDSLIVTDLITLAQNGAIKDAILLTGDEDIRVGVQLAQTFGVRVHLLGIFPARSSQSNLLMQEVDTRSEWLREDVMQVLEFVEQSSAENLVEKPCFDVEALTHVLRELLESFSSEAIQGFAAHVRAHRDLPRELDARMLHTLSRRLKNAEPLTREEARQARLQIRSLLIRYDEGS